MTAVLTQIPPDAGVEAPVIETAPIIEQAPPTPAPSVALEPAQRPVQDPSIERLAAIDRRLDLGFKLIRLDTTILLFDVSGPWWAAWLRGVGYAFLPLGLFTAPFLGTNDSPLSSLVPGEFRRSPQAAGPINSVHSVGWALLGTSIACLSAGFIAGVAGWAMKSIEFNKLKEQRETLEVEFTALSKAR